MIPYNLSTGNRFKYLRVYRVTTIRHNMTRQQLLARDFAGALERDSAHSLYEQITDRLRELLHSHVGPGGQVPTEESLTQLFGVSRSTVRKAVQRLVDDGVLVRRQGKGTFVTRPMPKIVHSIDRLAPFLETFRTLGEDIHTEVTRFEWTDGEGLPSELADWDQPVLRFDRRYVSRGVPHAVTLIQLPNWIGRRVSRQDVDARPVYDLLQKKLRIELAQAQFLVSCRQPSPEISEALEISQSSFLLVLERITRDTSGRAVEMTTHLLRPDVYQLSVRLKDLKLQR